MKADKAIHAATSDGTYTWCGLDVHRIKSMRRGMRRRPFPLKTASDSRAVTCERCRLHLRERAQGVSVDAFLFGKSP